MGRHAGLTHPPRGRWRRDSTIVWFTDPPAPQCPVRLSRSRRAGTCTTRGSARHLRRRHAGGLGTVCAQKCAQLVCDGTAVALAALAAGRADKTECLRLRVGSAQAVKARQHVEWRALTPISIDRPKRRDRAHAIQGEAPGFDARALREPLGMPHDCLTSVALVAARESHREEVAEGAAARDVHVDNGTLRAGE